MTKYTKDYMMGEFISLSKDFSRVVQNNTDVIIPVKKIMSENIKALNDNNAYHQKSNEALQIMSKKVMEQTNLVRFLVGSLVALLFISFITFSYLLGGKDLLPFLPKLPL